MEPGLTSSLRLSFLSILNAGIPGMYYQSFLHICCVVLGVYLCELNYLFGLEVTDSQREEIEWLQELGWGNCWFFKM